MDRLWFPVLQAVASRETFKFSVSDRCRDHERLECLRIKADAEGASEGTSRPELDALTRICGACRFETDPDSPIRLSDQQKMYTHYGKAEQGPLLFGLQDSLPADPSGKDFLRIYNEEIVKDVVGLYEKSSKRLLAQG